MTTLNTQSFSTLVSNFAAAVQSACSSLVNFTIGSVLLAIGQATSSIALWLQGMILQVLALTRLSTSTGTDVDTWLADFGFIRLSAFSASGLVLFSRFTPTIQAVIPVGTIIQTSDGTQQFIINADATNPAYSATVISGGGFIIPAGTSSISITATAITPGTIGNVGANSITTITGSIPYVDTVNNNAAFTNGVDAESDSAVQARFVLWLNSLNEGTFNAVKSAIASVQQNIISVILPNTQYGGITQAGYCTIIIDDGTGYPPALLLSNVGSAVAAVMPLGSTFGIHAPNVQSVNLSLSITSATGYVHSSVASAVAAALTTYINTLGRDSTLNTQSLPYTAIAGVAYAVPGVTNVTGVTLNGGSIDLTSTALQVFKAGTVTVI